MVLHKLTYAKDTKSKSLKGINEYKIESNQNLTVDLIKSVSKRNASPDGSSCKEVKTSEPDKTENHSVIVFKKARFESPNTSQEIISELDEPLNIENIKANIPILPLSPQWSLDELNSKNSYSKLEFSPIKEETIEVENIPILHLNVHIGGGVKKELNIYNTNTFYKEAEEFCKLYNLSDTKHDLLITIINFN